MKHAKIFLLIVLALGLLSGCQGKQEEGPQPMDEVSGHIWKGEDGSQLQLEEDGSFTWYLEPEAPNDHYYTGTYTVYNGNDAIAFLAESDYGITEGEQRQMISRVKDYTIETYYVLILNQETLISGGVNTLPAEGASVHYYGFFYPETLLLELGNLDAVKFENFTRTK